MAPGRGPVPVTRDLTKEILAKVDQEPGFNTQDTFPEDDPKIIKAALDRLGSRSMIEYEQHAAEIVVLEKEGVQIAETGSYEYKVWDAVREKGKIPMKSVAQVVGADIAKFGQGGALKNKWVKKEGDSLVIAQESVQDSTRQVMEKIRDTKTLDDAKLLADLRKRKLVSTQKAFSYTVKKGSRWAFEIPQEATDITADMLADGSWKEATFKPYNFKALGAGQSPGALHPLMKGFVEMPTGRFVDSGFWNFDSLFVPQQHPARESQDTFFISDPPRADPPREDPIGEAAMNLMEESGRRLYETPEKRQKKPRDYQKYFQDVKKVHSEGGWGSVGYRAPWSEEESLRLVLRTHTTSISTWVLHRLAEDPRPARYFSIDRVFRNEAVDNTHLAEFHQVEGVIADYGLTIGGLMKFMEDFFAKLGISDLRFKPAYNPYTEPSMEIFGYHEGLKKLVEIGNSGMFRPEMLEPMGIPRDLRIYGFGLSLERPTMIKYKVSNIRELLGHKVDLAFVEAQAAVRLDKN